MRWVTVQHTNRRYRGSKCYPTEDQLKQCETIPTYEVDTLNKSLVFSVVGSGHHPQHRAYKVCHHDLQITISIKRSKKCFFYFLHHYFRKKVKDKCFSPHSQVQTWRKHQHKFAFRKGLPRFVNCFQKKYIYISFLLDKIMFF